MKKLLAPSLLIVAVAAMQGCQQAPSLVGNWKLAEPITMQGMQVGEGTMEFTSDKKSTSTMTVTVMGQAVNMKMVGGYTVAEKSVTQTIDELYVNDKKQDLNLPMFAQIKQNASVPVTFEFEGNDKVKLTSSAGTSTWTRVK